jgi:hypothetical protein
MFNIKEYLLLHILTVSFLFLYLPIIQAAEEPYITLISSYRDLSVSQVLSIPNISIRNKHNYGFYGYSTIIHRYEVKSLNGDSVVTDHATGLMWHQSGSGKDMVWNEAKQWVKDLNNRGFAGYSDWRLPTVEEAISLLESNKKAGDLYIDTAFDVTQSGIWTGDENDTASYLDSVWSVRFSGAYGAGNVCWRYDNASNYVRPVRKLK